MRPLAAVRRSHRRSSRRDRSSRRARRMGPRAGANKARGALEQAPHMRVHAQCRYGDVMLLPWASSTPFSSSLLPSTVPEIGSVAGLS